MKEVELAEHQRKAVAKLQNGCVLTGGVGTGKTRVALRYYIEKECGRRVIVITTAKKRDSFDWDTEAALHGVGRETSVPVGGVCPGTITVDSWNNLWKYVDVEDAFFIFDEQRLVGSGKWVGTFYKIAKKNRWILLSATPGDTWLDYIPVFVANGFYKNKTEFLREHVVYSRFSKFPKVERYIAVGRLVRHRNALLVDMPYERHTKRVLKDVEVEHDPNLYEKVSKKRWHVYEERPIRDVAELFSVMRRVVNSNPSRIEAVRQLMTEHPRLIVFYNFDYELEILRGLSSNETWTSSCSNPTTPNDRSPKEAPGTRTSSESSTSPSKSYISTKTGTKSSLKTSIKGSQEPSFAIAEWNGHKHEEIPETDRWVYLVQYTAGAEGWNCISTNAVVFYSLNYSYRIFEQCQGRIDRLNTSFVELYYYILRSSSTIDKMIWRALTLKRKFNESHAMPKKAWDEGRSL